MPLEDLGILHRDILRKLEKNPLLFGLSSKVR
jgi:hypothetical protein